MSIEDKIKERMDKAVIQSYYIPWYKRIWGKFLILVAIVVLFLLLYFVYLLINNMWHINRGDIYNPELGWVTDEQFVQSQELVTELMTDDDPWLGAEQPLIFIVAYESFGCPYCKANQTDIKAMIAKFGSIARFITKDFPTDALHLGATEAHLAAACAHEQNKYWEYHDILFTNQGDFTKNQLKEYAKSVGLNQQQFDECLDTEKYKQEIKQDYASGVQAGVEGTPSYIINGNLFPGTISIALWEEIIGFILKEGF